MSGTSNKQLAMQFVEDVNGRKFDAVTALMAPGRTLTITLEGGQLYGQPANGGAKLALTRASGTTFAVAGALTSSVIPVWRYFANPGADALRSYRPGGRKLNW